MTKSEGVPGNQDRRDTGSPDYSFPVIQSEADLLGLFKLGRDMISEARALLPEDARQGFMPGNYQYTLGYLATMVGGPRNLAGKRITEVAGGSTEQLSFNASQARALAVFGAEVISVDPATSLIPFPELSNVRGVNARVQDYANSPVVVSSEVVISTAFLGGPEFLKETYKDADYPYMMLRAMRSIAPIQIHLVQESEINLETFDSVRLSKAGFKAVYNFNLSRQKHNTGYNDLTDFLVIDTRK